MVNDIENAEILLGLAATGAYIIIVGYLAAKYRPIRAPIIIGGAARFLLAWVVALRLFYVPDAGADAVMFERVAATWAELPWDELLRNFDPSRFLILSWIGAIIYKAIGHSLALLNLMNSLMSIWLIILTYRLADTLFGRGRGVAAAWIVTLFPLSVLYGSVFLREVWGSAFFMVGLLHAIEWAQKHIFSRLLIALAMFTVAGIFHAGYATGIIGLLIYAGGMVGFNMIQLRSRPRTNRTLAGAIATIVVVAGIAASAISGVSLDKVGKISEFSALDAVDSKITNSVAQGGSAYPPWLYGSDPFTNPAVAVGRVVYFFLSPFPWDIRSANHILGVVAPVYYFLILRSIWASRKEILRDRRAMLVLVVTMVPMLVFALSVDNIGTSLRHRTKFIYPLVTLCAVPLFRRLRWRRRPKIRYQ